MQPVMSADHRDHVAPHSIDHDDNADFNAVSFPNSDSNDPNLPNSNSNDPNLPHHIAHRTSRRSNDVVANIVAWRFGSLWEFFQRR
mmetsp:Transcript_3598/g.7287  ORF Transcript_3598/g.7287 Transcript_3598/m.7287 type:complete len:86 (-) Transcript_3598:231-488(-)